MTLEEIVKFSETYIEIIKMKSADLDWETVKTAFIDGAKTAVLGGLDWKKQ